MHGVCSLYMYIYKCITQSSSTCKSDNTIFGFAQFEFNSISKLILPSSTTSLRHAVFWNCPVIALYNLQFFLTLLSMMTVYTCNVQAVVVVVEVVFCFGLSCLELHRKHRISIYCSFCCDSSFSGSAFSWVSSSAFSCGVTKNVYIWNWVCLTQNWALDQAWGLANVLSSHYYCRVEILTCVFVSFLSCSCSSGMGDAYKDKIIKSHNRVFLNTKGQLHNNYLEVAEYLRGSWSHRSTKMLLLQWNV